MLNSQQEYIQKNDRNINEPLCNTNNFTKGNDILAVVYMHSAVDKGACVILFCSEISIVKFMEAMKSGTIAHSLNHLMSQL